MLLPPYRWGRYKAVLLLIVAATSSMVTNPRARARVWSTCIVDTPKIPTPKGFQAAICQLPHRLLVHVHVFKSGGTVVKHLLHAACDLLNGTKLPKLDRPALIRLLASATRPATLFSTHREPVERFYSALAEVARRGRLSRSISERAIELKDPLQTVKWMLEHQKEARIPQCNLHFAPAVTFLVKSSTSEGTQPWPLDYIFDPHQPGELELLWRILINGSDYPYPEVDGRHHQDKLYQLCLDTDRSCKFASKYSRSLMPYVLMEAHESTAWMNATLRQTLYHLDEKCYQAAQQAMGT